MREGAGKLGRSCHIIERLSNTMLIGYMRVSKPDGSQTIDLQRDALIAAGVDPAQIYEDRASGRLDARPGLGATLKALRTGDTLVVWRLDRLGRNLRHLVNTVHDLTKRGVGFKVLTGSRCFH
jgi:DNA invertase Pin-like site-specific DNA recombinase